MKKILYITPHLSTGGLPQYLCKKIETFIDQAEIFCVEYSFLGPEYVVQRNKISSLLQGGFFSLGPDKEFLLEIISNVNPDVIHFEELCETFVDENILLKIFQPGRNYNIFETCHSSTWNPKSKIFRPDKFVMVSEWIQKKYSSLGIPSEVLEYPIENKEPQKKTARHLLELDLSKKHVLNVGLFTPGKNQGEIFEYAEQLLESPVQFHFVGNTAGNFQEYWQPLLENSPKNCKIWGERSDVDLFYQACDLFLFTSNLELNPLAVKESLSWKLPVLMKRLETYEGVYDQNVLVRYLSEDKKSNLDILKKMIDI